jgi:hypothetical protein
VGKKQKIDKHQHKECSKDLELMRNIIKTAHNGISMNIIVYIWPTHVYCSNSCPAGLGGYRNSSFAWRYYLPADLQFCATNNLLEHLASIITRWVDIIQGHFSTTLEGLLCKTNFSKLNNDPIQATVRLEAARMHATHYITLGIREYSQWFPGKDNGVADSLSCYHDRSDNMLTPLFCTHCPSQIPEHF